MLKFYKRFLLFFGLFFFLNPLYSSDDTIFSRLIFQLARSQPESFICSLSGSAIDGRLKRIPQDAIEKRKIPQVMLASKNGVGQVIKVKNVDSLFENMFSLYNKYINLTGTYITKQGKTLQKFKKNYSFKVNNWGSYYRCKIQHLRSSKGTFSYFFVSKRKMLIRKVDFYRRNKMVYRIITEYRTIRGFNLPRKMNIKGYSSRKKTSAEIIFKNYKINPFIPNRIFKKI